MIKDSGQHVEHSTGAKRDSDTGRGAYELISPIFINRLAKHLEAGAEKYDPRNWEKGIPIARCFRSALRHIWQALAGYTDEDHLAAAACNLMFIMHTREMIRRSNLPANLDNVPNLTGVGGALPRADVGKPDQLDGKTPVWECVKCAVCARRCPHTKADRDCPWSCPDHRPAVR